MLRGLGLVFAGCLEVRNQRNMDIEGIILSGFPTDLTDGVNEGLAFDIADGAADFSDDHICIRLFTYRINEAFDFIGDVRNRLHGRAEISALTFPGDDVGIDLAGGQVGEFVQILVDKALVMAEIKIGLRAILGDIDFTMLVRAHSAGIYIDVGVQLLCRNLQSSRFQKTSQGRCCYSLAQSGNYAARDKNILFHVQPPAKCSLYSMGIISLKCGIRSTKCLRISDALGEPVAS